MTENTRYVRRTVMSSLLIAALLVAGVLLYMAKRPQLLYDRACVAAAKGEYAQMDRYLESYLDCAEEKEYYQAILTFAEMADTRGDTEVALALLERPEPAENEAYAAFAEAAAQAAAVCTYHQAMRLYEAGEYAASARLAAEVRQYEPALALYKQAESAYQAGLTTPAPTPAPTPSPTAQPDALPTPAPTAEQQPPLWTEGRLATGFAHTVVLMEDGTVRAFGDNTYGQTDVADWTNVVAVAAGAYHTLGLTADGRVLACGDNTYGQADTTLFTGVEALAAGDYTTCMLLSAGEVFCVGFQTYGFLQSLGAAEHLWAGSYGLAVQTADGLNVSHPSLALDAPCQSMALSRGYAIGIDAQGNTHCSTPLVPAWTNVARVSAGENAALALTENGEVLSHAFGTHNRADFTFEQPVVALSAAPEHYAFVRADGVLDIRYADGHSEEIMLYSAP